MTAKKGHRLNWFGFIPLSYIFAASTILSKWEETAEWMANHRFHIDLLIPIGFLIVFICNSYIFQDGQVDTRAYEN